MTADSVGAVMNAFTGSAAATAGSQSAGASSIPFSGVLGAVVSQTATLDQQAQSAVTGLLDGSGTDVHTAMIATQRADMAFELALQVRNKAVGAYQQMMQMQF